MNIAYVCADPGIPVFGTKGASVHVQEVIRALRRAGHQVEILCLRRGDDVPADLADVKVHTFPLAKDLLTTAKREEAVWYASRNMVETLAAMKPDWIIERYSLFSADVMLYAKENGIPCALEVNAPLWEEQLKYRELVHLDRAKATITTAAQAASVVISVSTPVADWVKKHAPLANVLMLPNGVNVERIQPVVPRQQPSPLMIGFIGTLKPWHGVEVLFNAVALTGRSDWQLCVVGDGPQAEVLHQQAEALGLRVEFTGAVAPSRIPTLLQCMDIAVAPYTAEADPYFSPLKVYEYAAAGLPIVAGAYGQLSDVLVHEKTALLFPPGDHQALAQQLLLLAGSTTLRHQLGSAARQWALGQTWDAVVERMLQAMQTADSQRG